MIKHFEMNSSIWTLYSNLSCDFVQNLIELFKHILDIINKSD